MNKSKCFPDVKCTYGAPMGRRNVLPSGKVKLRLCRAIWTDGGYDQGGAYFGATPLFDDDGNLSKYDYIYCAYNISGVRIYVRASTRREAAAIALEDCIEGSTCGGYTVIAGECVSVYILKAQSKACKERIKWHLNNIKTMRSEINAELTKPIEDYEA